MPKTVKTYWGTNGAPCNAPFNNMYFTVHGKVSPCWKLPGFCDQWSEERSIMDIWKGEHFQKYRDALMQCNFLNRCKECEVEIENEVWPLAKAYQQFGTNDNGYPTLMELELSNQCNLECIMCSGELSSGIRKKEGKPPLPQIYNDAFINQLEEFIPHLKELRFNGGEPFAQKIVLDICDMVAKINPNLAINMATNGTVFNKRVQHILDNNNISINISIDSLIPERYEQIRINGDFDVLMKNVEIYKDYCHTNNRNLSIMVNPMRNNWEEMGHFAEWASEIKAALWYNTILYPKHLSIWNLSSEELENIYDVLHNKVLNMDNTIKNYKVFKHLVENQIRNWLLDSYVL